MTLYIGVWDRVIDFSRDICSGEKNGVKVVVELM